MAGVQWKKPQNMIDRTGGVVYRDRKDAKIALLAFGSRVLVLGWMFLSTRLYRKLDTSTSLQNFACIEDGRSVNAEPRPGPWGLDALAPWDTVYFLRIAKCGYEFDIFNAFFPLYPFLMRYIVAMLSFLKLDLISQMVPIETEYLVIGLLANLVAFCCAAVALHHLSLEVTRSHSLSNLAVIFFCFNPSSVFYSAAYTEALYAAFTWSGLVILHRNYFWGGTFVLAAATGVRSNGVLNCFFVAYKLFISRGQRHRKESQFSHSQWFPLFTKMLQFIGSCFIIVAPNLFMQGKCKGCREILPLCDWIQIFNNVYPLWSVQCMDI